MNPSNDLIMECYKDLAISITLQDCKAYYARLLKIPTYRSTNRSWYIRETERLRDYLINDSWMAHMGADMLFVVQDLERRAKKREPLAWKRVVDTANNMYTKGV